MSTRRWPASLHSHGRCLAPCDTVRARNRGSKSALVLQRNKRNIWRRHSDARGRLDMGNGREGYPGASEGERTSDTFTPASPDHEFAVPPVDVAMGIPRREFLKLTTVVVHALSVWPLLRTDCAASAFTG